MKKNAMLKIAAILLVAVLLTTCAISSTFAKYVAVGTADTAEARVAKFGITAVTTAVSDFATEYTPDDGTATVALAVENDGSDEKGLIAPGTTDTITVDTSATGTAEVAVKVETTVTVALNGFAESYVPVYFTIGGTTYKHTSIGGTYNSITALLGAVNEAATFSTQVEPNQAISVDDGASITWAWDFEDTTHADENADGIDDRDALDLTLKAGTAGITVTANTTITQID